MRRLCLLAGLVIAARALPAQEVVPVEPRGTTWRGWGITLVAASEVKVPFLAHRITRIDGALVLPDLGFGVLALPLPLLVTADPHIGVAWRTGTTTLIASAGPSIAYSLFSEPAFIPGWGAGVSVIAASEPGRTVRFDLGRRFYRLPYDSGPSVWFLSITFLSSGRPRPTCPCEAQ